MELPGYQPFYIESLGELRTEIARLALEIPTFDDLSPLAEPITIGRVRIPNRLCAQPISGHDAEPGGAPGELTHRRYRRYAEGRFGLIWVEATAAGASDAAGGLCLRESTLAAFRGMVQEMRASAAENPAIILQLAPGPPAALIHAARLAAEAGFDGVDLQCGRDALPEALAGVRDRAPDLLLAARLVAYEAVRGGFGVSPTDFRKPNLDEPIRFIRDLHACGLALLNVTASSPRLSGPERGVRSFRDSENPEEHPLMALDRQLRIARALRETIPDLPVVGSGFSWLRHFMPEVAAGALHGGMIDFAGLGRGALANPSAPAEIFAQGRAETSCMICHACSRLRDEGEAVGCVLRDPAVYGPIYQRMRRFDGDRLLAGAARCHLCEAAPCVAASPTRTDIPGFIRAFREGDEARAYEIIRERDPVPELTARFSPGWMECEGSCIETTLTGTPVPILDLQYAIAWRARDRGETGLRLASASTGKTVAIIGGGPAGIAATIRLAELGYTIDLYDQSDRLGGVLERVLAARRHWSPQAEIAAILQPALAAGRLRLHLSTTLGRDLPLDQLRTTHDAILIATGLWQEPSLGTVPGVISALPFLEAPEDAVPERVAVLAGGDAAMDAARAAQDRGATAIFVIFGGPRSALHWHMPESWFATPGVHALMSWQPLGYQTGPEGRVAGVRLRHTELLVETVLPVHLVVEAMELQIADDVRAAIADETGPIYTAGAVTNGGASVSHCQAEGLAAADKIHHDLFP